MEESEELRLLRENNEMLKELLTIARQHTDPDYIKSENEAELRININVIKNECYIGDIASSVEYETDIVTKIGR